MVTQDAFTGIPNLPGLRPSRQASLFTIKVPNTEILRPFILAQVRKPCATALGVGVPGS